MFNNGNFTEKDVEKVFNSLDESLKKTKTGKSIKQNLDLFKKKPAQK